MDKRQQKTPNTTTKADFLFPLVFAVLDIEKSGFQVRREYERKDNFSLAIIRLTIESFFDCQSYLVYLWRLWTIYYINMNEGTISVWIDGRKENAFSDFFAILAQIASADSIKECPYLMA